MIFNARALDAIRHRKRFQREFLKIQYRELALLIHLPVGAHNLHQIVGAVVAEFCEVDVVGNIYVSQQGIEVAEQGQQLVVAYIKTLQEVHIAQVEI